MTDIVSIATKEKGCFPPDGYWWDAKLVNGMKEGKVTVYDEDGCVTYVLYYLNDKRNGICEFYDSGTIKEKRTFVNDVEQGWACEIENRKEVRWYLYSDGIRTTQLVKCDSREDYWNAIDLTNDNNHTKSICKYNDNHLPTDKGCLFQEGHIKKVVLFQNGKETNILKKFDNNEMTEYDNKGNIVYKGGFADIFLKDYPREGKGKEYGDGNGKTLNNGRVLLYKGEWKNGQRDGKGKTLKNGFAEYEGEWKEGLPNGSGILEREGKLYKGNWVMGKLKLVEGGVYDFVSGEVDMVKKFVVTVNIVIENEDQLRELVGDESLRISVKELVIGEGCGNEMKDDLELCGFENLGSIVVKKNTLENLNSLKISDNPQLKTFNTGDKSFYMIKSLIMESMLIVE